MSDAPKETNRMFDCPLCGGKFEEGFVLDETRREYKPAEWISDEPPPSNWTGTSIGYAFRRPMEWCRRLFISGIGGTNISGAVRRPMEAFRCTECGYVMLFARKAK